MNRYLITGASGFIGKNLCDHLRAQGDCKLIMTPSRGFFDGEYKHEIEKFNPDYIVHCAGEMYEEPLMYQSNVELTHNLLEATRKIDYKGFIYVGSSYEYLTEDADKLIADENCTIDPYTIYQATKACGTLLCQAYARSYNKPIVVVRPFSVYGKGEKERRFFPTIYRCAISGELVTVHDGKHDFIYIDDVVRGIEIILSHENPKQGQVVNLGTGITSTNLDVVFAFMKAFERSINFKIAEPRKYLKGYDETELSADISYAKFRYGFLAAYSLERGVAKYVETMK